jgi:crotonobetainyl-CoA:carnitine CoA-transferase CaiB-like acyl-CoA transferase
MMLNEDRYWEQVCRALGLEDLTDRYPDAGARRSNWGSLGERFAACVGGLTHDELERRLRAEGCIYSLFAPPPEVVRDEAVVDNGYLMAHPSHPSLRLAAAPGQFDNELPTVRRPGPTLGEHSREVLSELGYHDDDVERLIRDAVVVAP